MRPGGGFPNWMSELEYLNSLSFRCANVPNTMNNKKRGKHITITI